MRLLGLLLLAFALKAMWLDHNYSDAQTYALIGIGLRSGFDGIMWTRGGDDRG